MFKKIWKLFTHSIVYGLGNSGNRLIGFFLLPVYTRYLTPEDYGVLAMVGMFGQVLFVMANMGQASAFFRTYYLHDEEEERETVLTTALWLILTVSFPIGLLALALSHPLGVLLTGNADYTWWVALGVGGIVFRLIGRIPLQVLRAHEESRRYAVWSFARTLVGLTTAILFVVGLQLGGRGVLMSQLMAELVLGVVLLPSTVRGLKLRYSSSDARDMLGYGIYLVPAGLLSFVIHLSDRFFLRTYLDLAVVGLYSLGYRLGEIISFPMQAFGLAYPQFLFGNRKSDNAPELYARVFTYYFVILGAIWLAVSLLAEQIVQIAMAPDFHESYRVVPWIAGAYVCQGLAFVGDAGIKLTRKVKWRPVILAVAAVLNVGLNFWLIPRYGMMGAAIANFSTFAFQGLLRVGIGNIFYPLPYEYPRLARITAIIVILYSTGSLIAWSSPWTAIAGKGLLLLGYPTLLYLSRFFEDEELTAVRGLRTTLQKRAGALLQDRGASD